MHTPLPRRFAVALLLVLAPFGQAADHPAPPSKASSLGDVLLRSPDFELGRLSPDGAHFAFIREVKDLKVLDCYEFKTGKFYRLVPSRENIRKLVSDMTASGRILPGGGTSPTPPPDNVYENTTVQHVIGNFFWTGSNQLIVQDGEQNLDLSGLWVSDAIMQKTSKVNSNGKFLLPIAALPQNPEAAFLRELSAKTPFTPLWRLNKKTSTVAQAESNPGRVLAWHLDQAGQLRLATVDAKDGNTSYLYRAVGAKDWESVSLPNLSRPVTFDASGQNVLVAFPGPDGRDQLQGFNLAAKQFTDNPIADPVHDINPDVINDSKTGLTVGLVFETTKPAFLWLNAQYAQIHGALAQSFPGATVQIHGVMETGEVLFTASSDVSPPVLYRYHAEKREIRAVMSALPEAAKMKWAPMQPVSFAARDGATLHGYLTLPPGRAGQKVPLVALAHDGPLGRVTWGFDPEVQFLAALGYGVLQVNYRGSTGYGRDYALKNSVEVCEKSVDDVVDGIRWAIASGHADPARVAACGENYGGYIALGIATRYPEVTAAAISSAGIYDWETQLKDDSLTSSRLLKSRKDYYLDPKTSGDRYRPFSPARAADKVRCPVLLLHGGDEAIADISQSNRMSRALRDAGKSVEVIKDTTTHRAFCTSLAAFLLKHVPPDS